MIHVHDLVITFFSYIIRDLDFLYDFYYKKYEFLELLLKAKNSGNSVLINMIRKLNNSCWVCQINDDISIQDIFIEEFDNFLADNPDLEIRESVINKVDKMKKCCNYDYGYTFYECLNCNNFHIQGFTYKSRFCPRCSKKI